MSDKKKHFSPRQPNPELHIALKEAGYTGRSTSALAKLVTFAAQASGIDPANYGGENGAFRQDVDQTNNDWVRFQKALVRVVAEHVQEEDLLAVAPQAFSGRLEWKDGDWEYCTGQYFPTEYRKAAAVLLEYALRRVRQARPAQKRRVYTLEDLKALNEANGGCWFDPATMEYFGTQIESLILHGKYFITSEQPPNGPRKFSIRSFNDCGSIDTVGDFCSHKTLAAALKALRKEAPPVKKPRRAVVKQPVGSG